jgi:membrane protein DedA with SNARE-associated domain
MLHSLIASFSHWIVSAIAATGYPAVFILMTLESALLPIPSEVTMPFAGFLVGQGYLNFWLVVFTGALGNLAGSLAAYSLGYWGQEHFVRKLIHRWGKYFFITYHEVETAERWFRQRGELITFASRLLPVVRTYVSLPAGFSQMSPLKFSLYTLTGSFIWSAFLTWLGLELGQNWTSLEIYFRKFQYLIIGGLILLILFYAARKYKKIRQSETPS